MTDLEKLLRDRQDQLRGRPEDWIDKFGRWRRSIDWVWVCIYAIIFAWLWFLMEIFGVIN